jgi:hypothetical protein
MCAVLLDYFRVTQTPSLQVGWLLLQLLSNVLDPNLRACAFNPSKQPCLAVLLHVY